MLLLPKKEIKDLRDYIGFSQNIQQLILKKEFKYIDSLLKEIKISNKNKFMIVQFLRQTFPHRKELFIWKDLYNDSISLLKISEIKTFGEI